MDVVFTAPLPPVSPLRTAIRDNTRIDETMAVEQILAAAEMPAVARDRIAETARRLVTAVRRERIGKGGIDAFLHEYALSSQEGVALLCLAEALLRIPDAETVDRLIRDKLGDADWARHLGHSNSVFVNASTWALMLTGRLLHSQPEARDLRTALRSFVARSGEPVVRQAVTAAMRILARQFVMGRTIEEALERARTAERQGYRHSYDMLGEAAHTAADAARYLSAYEDAIVAIGRAVAGRSVAEAPGISVKLSALHPRYEMAQRDRVLAEMGPRLLALARRARDAGIGFTIDAEEADRLDLSLDLVEALALAPDLAGWDGFGLAVQAYQKRALPLIDWLADLARRGKRRLMVRLVKGAYWDSEIKRSQERGLDGYPVFTRKLATDVCYLACARRLLDGGAAFFPQFATHNAHTVAAILELAGERRDWEFQRLHGMGEALYEEIVGPERLDRPCRVYAPVGSHEELLAYLVRRLLENGANTSFVNRIVDERQPIDEIIADPIARLARLPVKPHPQHPAAGRSLSAGAAEFARARSEPSADVDHTARRTYRCAPTTMACRPDHRRSRTVRRGRSGPRSQQSPAPGRHGRLGRSGDGRPRTRPRRVERARLGTHAGRRTRCDSGTDRRSVRTAPGRADGADHPRGRAHDPGGALGSARSRRLPALLRRACARPISPRPKGCPAQPASATNWLSMGAASSPASRRGISRWRSSPARSQPHSPPAMPLSPSPPSRPR